MSDENKSTTEPTNESETTVESIVDELHATLRKQSKLRFRNTYVVFGCLLVLFALTATSPDAQYIQQLHIGAGTIETLISIMKGVLGASLLFFTGLAMMDYAAADFEKLGLLARQSPEGAGYYAIAVAIKYIAFAIVIVGTYFIS